MSYYQMQPMSGFAGLGCCGMGGIDFNAGSVWSDWLAGASGNAAAGKRAAQSVQAALNQIGYGPLSVDGQFGKGSVSAWARFASDTGVGGSWPTQAGIIKLGEQVNKGGDQGGGGVIESHVVAGQFVPGAASPLVAAAKFPGGMLGVGALVIAGIIGIVVISKKQKTA